MITITESEVLSRLGLARTVDGTFPLNSEISRAINNQLTTTDSRSNIGLEMSLLIIDWMHELEEHWMVPAEHSLTYVLKKENKPYIVNI